MNLDEIYKRLEVIDSERATLEEAILGIDLKLEEVKLEQITTGVMPNVKWLYRAKYALGCKKIELKKLNIERESLKRMAKAKEKERNQIRTESFERIFVKIAKDYLAYEEFQKIKNLANDFIENKNNIEEKEVRTIKKGTSWSKEDEKYLKENYKNATIEELSIALGRSENAIKSKIQIIKKKAKS